MQRDKVASADNQQERLPAISPDYIVGLVDGEGYFSISPRKRNVGGREVIEVDCVFGIDLKEQDRPILERIQQYFGCGTLYFRNDTREKFSNLWAYRVRTHKGLLENIIPFFTEHQLQIPSKRKSFELFKEVLLLVQQRQHQTADGFDRIRQLVSGRILRDHTPSASKEDEDMVHAL